ELIVNPPATPSPRSGECPQRKRPDHAPEVLAVTDSRFGQLVPPGIRPWVRVTAGLDRLSRLDTRRCALPGIKIPARVGGAASLSPWASAYASAAGRVTAASPR